MMICRAATTHGLETKSTTTNRTKGQTKAIKRIALFNGYGIT